MSRIFTRMREKRHTHTHINTKF